MKDPFYFIQSQLQSQSNFLIYQAPIERKHFGCNMIQINAHFIFETFAEAEVKVGTIKIQNRHHDQFIELLTSIILHSDLISIVIVILISTRLHV
jgi:hypothetical protein